MFSSVVLDIEAPLSDSAVSRPLEACYQDKYYRASFEMPGNLYLKSELVGTQQTGWVDFAIPSETWIVECVRDGDKLKEHIERFQTTGKSRQWISNQEAEEFIFLDFRQFIPIKQRGMHLLFPPVSLPPPPSFLTAHFAHFFEDVKIDWLFHVVFADYSPLMWYMTPNARLCRAKSILLYCGDSICRFCQSCYTF